MCMSLVTLREAVSFGHPKNDPVDLVFAIGAIDNRTHLKALSELQELLHDQESVSTIRNAVHKWQIARLLRRFPSGSSGVPN